MSTKTQVEWRRRSVFELSSKGHSQVDIAKTLQISESTISRDLDYLKQQSRAGVVSGGSGAFAEMALANAESIAYKPEKLSHAEASALHF